MKNHSIKAEIKKCAKSLGFDLIGFSSAETNKEALKFYKSWLKEKRHGKMAYLEKINPRKTLQKILPGAKTVISLGMNYYYKQKPLKKGFGRIARYAYGRDYHKVIGKKLKQLETLIKTLQSNAKTKSYIDAGPILERSFAEKAGLGAIGKNSCLITKEFGSWVFLGEIITNLEIAQSCHSRGSGNCHSRGSGNLTLSFSGSCPSGTVIPARQPASGGEAGILSFPLCGSCTRCIDSCPTQAIIAPGVIDARKCISYLTIENKKQIPKKFHEALKKSGRLFGCDICQEVCPHNCRAVSFSRTREPHHSNACHSRLACHSRESGNPFPAHTDQLDLKKILQIKSDAEFLALFAGTPLMRAKRKGLQRNAKCLL